MLLLIAIVDWVKHLRILFYRLSTSALFIINEFYLTIYEI